MKSRSISVDLFFCASEEVIFAFHVGFRATREILHPKIRFHSILNM